EAAARPVRNPPSSCFRAWVAPCIRRFNSLMSNLPVDITLSPQKTLGGDRRALARGRRAQSWSADDGATTGATQDGPNRARFGDREHDDRQRRLAGKRECGRIHHLVAALDGL